MKVLGVFLVVLALVAGISPMFSDCQSQGRTLEVMGKPVAMKCHWAGVSELVAALPLGVLGIVGVVGVRRKETRRVMSITGGVLGMLIVLLPTQLIGVCANPDMICNLVMRPVLTLAGGLTMVVSLVGLVLARGRDMEEVAES
jgi:hypothetical protein